MPPVDNAVAAARRVRAAQRRRACAFITRHSIDGDDLFLPHRLPVREKAIRAALSRRAAANLSVRNSVAAPPCRQKSRF